MGCPTCGKNNKLTRKRMIPKQSSVRIGTGKTTRKKRPVPSRRRPS